MPPDQNPIGNYFDTPARAERLQLLLYLVRNAGEVIYLRAPPGAGKTLFAQRLFDTLSDQVAAVWVRGSQDCDVAAAAVDQLGLPPDSARHWPDAVLEGLDGQELLLIVDDADRLGLSVVESLDLLHAHGGRLLLDRSLLLRIGRLLLLDALSWAFLTLGGISVLGCLDDEVGQGRFAAMAHNGMHAIDPFDFFRGDLGVAAGYNDDGARVTALQLSDHLTRLHGRFLGNGAGVHDTHIGNLAVFNDLPTTGAQCRSEDIGFVLIDFAS